MKDVLKKQVVMPNAHYGDLLHTMKQQVSYSTASTVIKP